MSTAEILKMAQAVGVSVKLDGNDLVLEASDAPPFAVVDALFRHKADIVALLRPRGPDVLPQGWSERVEERAAVVEFDGGIPRAWAEGFARLNAAKPPADVPPRRWRQFIDDAGRFLDDGWADCAAALGWGPLNLFGCDRYAPFARVDHSGLLWLLDGNKLIDLQRDKGVVQFRSGSRQTYYRCPVEVGRVVLAWELAQ